MILKPCLWCTFAGSCDVQNNMREKTKSSGLTQGSFKCKKFETQFAVGDEVIAHLGSETDSGEPDMLMVRCSFMGWSGLKAVLYVYPECRDGEGTNASDQYPVIRLSPKRRGGSLVKTGQNSPCCSGCQTPLGQVPSSKFGCEAKYPQRDCEDTGTPGQGKCEAEEYLKTSSSTTKAPQVGGKERK